jgi:hypothetical protein
MLVAIMVGSGVAASIGFGSWVYFAVCLVSALLSVAGARWFSRKIGLDRYLIELEEEVASKRARKSEHRDAR